MNLKEKWLNLPSTPGVYLHKDAQGNIIYVGKAKNLKRRVGSYLSSTKGHSPKVGKLVKQLKDFDFILTDTEFEAFLQECKLIKEFNPVYNSKMKSPQSYTYLQINMNKKLPSIKSTRNPRLGDENLCFGPYTSKNTVDLTLRAIKEYYKIMCSNPSMESTLCLNHSLNMCIGMCEGGSKVEEYQAIVKKIIALLRGSDTALLKDLEQKMTDAAKLQDFESAAKYRDYLNRVQSLIRKEKIIEFMGNNRKILIVEHLSDTVIKFFLIMGNKVLFSEKYTFSSDSRDQLCRLIKEKSNVYFASKTPPLIKIDKEDLDEFQIIYSYLQSSSCNYCDVSQDWLDEKDNIELEEHIDHLLDTKKKS